MRSQKNARGASDAHKVEVGFTDEERAAMKERLDEVRRESGPKGAAKASGEADLLAKIAAMQPTDRAVAERIHQIVQAAAPHLSPKTWYGMPAWAKNGDVVCFFQSGQKFKTRYSTLGFSDKASLDDGGMWPTAFALKSLTTSEEARIAELVKRAAQ